jgi:L-ascorbate metabolism protein UlaG (beta-lactamase superfamily)
MIINYLGHSCFKIKTDLGVVIVDPFSDEIGLKMPREKADIVTVSHDHNDHNNVKAIKFNGKEMVIRYAGEYEIQNISVFGYDSCHDNENGACRGKNIIFNFFVEGMNVCHLGDLGEELTEAKIKEIGNIDILMIPIGGKYTIDIKQALALVNKIEPRIFIPMHYQQPGLSEEFAELKGLKDLVNEYGMDPAPVKKLMIDKNKLPEETELVIMERNV